jgi:hypothetical protein
MTLLANFFNRLKSTENRPSAIDNRLAEPADFPAPGALTPAIMAILVEMVSQCQGLARQAEDKGDLKTALAAIKESHKLLMNLAKLDAARLKAQQTQAAAQTTAPAPATAGLAQPGQTKGISPVQPAPEPDRRGKNPQASNPGATGPELGDAKKVPPQPGREDWPPNARGITNLGNYVY